MIDIVMMQIQSEWVQAYLKNIGFFIFLTAFSAMLTWLCRRYVRIMDYATERSSHSGAIPRSGGIAIVITFCLGILTYRMIHTHPFILFHAFWGLFLSALIISLVSFYDDITNRGLIFKVLSQLTGALILFVFGIIITEIKIPFYGVIQLGWFSYPITLLWIIGMVNAFNFMDGLNGLAAGVAAIVSLVFMLFCMGHKSWFMFHVAYMLAAACIGFIFFNFPKGSIFMGDVGSTFLGFCLAAMAILAANYDSAHTPFVVMPILMSNFIMETLFTFVWRLMNRQQVFEAHNMHPYQLLTRMGVSSEKVTLIYFGQIILLSAICYVYVRYLSDSAKLLMVFSVACLYAAYFMLVLNKAKNKGMLHTEKRHLGTSVNSRNFIHC